MIQMVMYFSRISPAHPKYPGLLQMVDSLFSAYSLSLRYSSTSWARLQLAQRVHQISSGHWLGWIEMGTKILDLSNSLSLLLMAEILHQLIGSLSHYL